MFNRILSVTTGVLFTLTLSYQSFGQCTPAATNCTFGDGITLFDLNTINNPSGCETSLGVAGYNLTALTTTLEQGGTYTVGLQSGYSSQQVSIWINFNDDANYDASELVLTDFAVGTSYVTTTINIPAGANLGLHNMRVQATYAASSSADPCTVGTYGETEDYTVTIIAPPPMSYVSSTTTQAVTGNVENCATSAEIMGIQIETTGTTSPLTATQFNLSTAGVTNLGDIGAINIYYTGNSSAFATGTLFGTVAPGGAVNVNGSQTLATGTNYFWVEYTLNPPMTNGNVLDVSCTGLTVSATGYTPTVTSPAGSRSIGACNPSPGGVSGNLQTWFDANQGISGSPVTGWNNLGPNANITTLSSTNGGTLDATDRKANYNNIINTTGGYDGTFHATVTDRTQVIAGSGVTMYVAYQRQSYPDLSFNFHSSIFAGGLDGTNQWRSWGFRHGGLGSLFSNGASHLYNAPMQAQSSENSGFVGLFGTENSAGGNTMDGAVMNYANIGAFYSGTSDMTLSVGYWPGWGMSRGVMEAILWDKELSTLERNQVETYLALKYGIMLGMNGTGIDFISPSTGTVIWDVSANPGYNWDVAGIMRSDVSGLDQRKSHSTNGTAVDVYNDIVTMANGTNFASPTAFGLDRASLLWGHNNAAMINTSAVVNYPTDNAEVIQTIFSRRWKSQEDGVLGTVTIEFDLSNVVGVGGVLGTNDLANVRLLVDEDDDYTTGATSIAPSAYNNATGVVYFQHDFLTPSGNPMDQNRGFFFTIGSTDALLTPLPVELMEFNVTTEECTNEIRWTTASEVNSDYFIIERSYNMSDWEVISKLDGAGNSSQQLEYLYRDQNYTKNGSVYYRVIQFDYNGNNTLLEVKGVNSFCFDNIEPIAYPNPMQNTLFIESPMEGTVSIVDLNGRMLKSVSLMEGVNSIDVMDLATGSYMVTILLNSDKKFVKQFIKY